MRKLFSILVFVILVMHSCTKEVAIPTSGTATINNILTYNSTQQAYFAYGFLFSKAELVSTIGNSPDITVDSDGTNLFLQTNNLKNSFHKYGEYSDEASAIQAFNDIDEVNVTQWLEWASSLKPHQVWIYRSGSEHYAKIRIISTVSEVGDSRDYAECTFEWVYQPDGSLTFPAE
ncbi:MAG: hypothetical protein V1903_02220 [Bacteroidota bacterium]